jgi:hypothetical protein
MFPARFHRGPDRSERVPAWGAERSSRGSAIPRIGLAVLLTAALPAGVSAQALGTMQVTARVIPGRPAWDGLSEARTLARAALLAPSTASGTRRADLVQARAEFNSSPARRRLMITVNYPRN